MLVDVFLTNVGAYSGGVAQKCNKRDIDHTLQQFHDTNYEKIQIIIKSNNYPGNLIRESILSKLNTVNEMKMTKE